MQKYFNSVTNSRGDAILGARVAVSLANGSLATIYSDNGVTTQPNPITTDGNGYFAFYAADGRYDLRITAVGIKPVILNDILLEDIGNQLTDFEERVYPGVYETPPGTRPSGAACVEGDRCTILVGGIGYEHLRSGGVWVIPNIDAVTLATSNGGALVGCIASGPGAIARTIQDQLNEAPSLFGYIPISEQPAIVAGTSTYDCTAAVVAAFTEHDVVKAPGGLFNVTTFNLGDRKRLLTDGFSTTFQQVAGQPVGTRMIKVTGSDVEIGDLTVRGNIATDTDEQSHSIYVQANGTVGNLRNIKIGNVNAFDVRGDAVYVGQANGGANLVSNVSIGDVALDNIYRNGVSIVSGTGIRVRSVTGARVGFCHLDIESNATSGPCVDIDVGYVKGRVFGVIGTTAVDYVDAVRIGTLDLSPSHAGQSSPSYPLGVPVIDGLLLRNVKRLRIDHMKAEGFGRCAIFTTYNVGELGAQQVDIGTLHMRNCSVTDAVYNAYVVAASSKLRIGSLDIDIAVANKYGFSSIAGLEFGRVAAACSLSSTGLLRSCNDAQIGQIVMTGSGVPIQNSQRVTIGGGSIAGDRLASGSNKCKFENLTATATTFLFSSGNEDHTVINSTLNGDYYSFGTGIRNHLNTMRFGIYQLWVSSDGKLRIKAGIPSTDTDGTVVGTQT